VTSFRYVSSYSLVGMDSKLYRQLNECIAEECWTKIRDIVAVQLMGPTFDYFFHEKSTEFVSYAFTYTN